MGRLVGELDRLGVHGGRDLGHVHGFGGGLGGSLGRQVDGGRETPGAVHDDADGKAQIVAIELRLHVAVGQADLLAPDPLGAEVCVRGA